MVKLVVYPLIREDEGILLCITGCLTLLRARRIHRYWKLKALVFMAKTEYRI